MATHLLCEPESLLAPDLEETIERVWSESLRTEQTSQSTRIQRREAHSFREFTVFDPKAGTTNECLPTPDPG